MTAVVSALLPPMLLLLVHLLTRLTAIRTLCRQFSQRNVARLPRQVSDACACAHVTSPPPSVQQASQQRSTWAHHCRHRCRCQLSSRLALPSARHLVPNVANSAHAHARARALADQRTPPLTTHTHSHLSLTIERKHFDDVTPLDFVDAKRVFPISHLRRTAQHHDNIRVCAHVNTNSNTTSCVQCRRRC
jgi:hypothetical protein